MAEEMNSHEGENERQPGEVITNKKFVFFFFTIYEILALYFKMHSYLYKYKSA